MTYCSNDHEVLCFHKSTEKPFDVSSWSPFNLHQRNICDDEINSVCFSKRLYMYVAVGENGIIKTSSDGIIWTYRFSGINVNLFSVLYLDTIAMFLAVSDSGILLRSTDAICWIQEYKE